MDNKRRLILHGGMPKTGSTSIQVALASEAWQPLLDSARIHFLTEPSDKKGNLSPQMNAVLGAPAWKGAEVHGACVQALTETIRGVLATLPAGFSVLISAEAVGEVAARDRASLARIRDYLDGLFSEIRLVLYIREPLSYACSRCQQALKYGYPVAGALRGALVGCDVAALVRNAREVFGAENVVVRPFDRALMASPDVVADFAAWVLGSDPSVAGGLIARRLETNRGLTMELTDVLLELYQARGVNPRNVNNRFVNIIQRTRWQGAGFAPDFFHDEDRERLIETAAKARLEVVDLLGFDPFPSYQPVDERSWRASEVDPVLHARNLDLLKDPIAARERALRVAGISAPLVEPGDLDGDSSMTQGTARGRFLAGLHRLYDLCELAP